MNHTTFAAVNRLGAFNPFISIVAIAASFMLVTESSATVIIEDSIDTVFVSNGQWYENDVRPGGVASIATLTGVGGNLENNAPLPQSAARLTTGFDNSHKAEIGVADAYGTAGNILNSSFELSYSFYKEEVLGGNVFAAPSIKLTYYNAAFAGDGFVTLVYESYLNGDSPVGTGDWSDVQIDLDNGLFWQTGGFGQSFDQSKLFTLNDWLTEFDADFLNAEMLMLSVGVGSFNQGQDVYFDNVSLAYETVGAAIFDKTYNFEAATEVSESGTLSLLGVSLLALGYIRRRSIKHTN